MSEQSVNDIISFVIQVEKEGAAFYRKLAAEVRGQATKNVFLGLLKDEVQHQKDFESIAEAMGGGAYAMASDMNLAGVMSAVVDRLKRGIAGSELLDMDGATLKEALDIGIHTERETIRVYTELLGIQFPELAKVLPRVIDEEKKHLASLENLKAKLLG